MANEELAVMAARGDTNSMNALYIAVAPLVFTMSRKYFPLCSGKMVDPEDLIQCGYFAVREAVEAFDPTRGCKFTTTLKFHVQRVCLRELGYRKKQIETISLCMPINEEENLKIEDTIEDPNSKIYEYIELNEMQKIVREAVNDLAALQKYTIYRYHFGGATLEKIAAELKRSKTTVSDILKSAYFELASRESIWEIWEAYSGQEPTEFWSPIDYAIAMEAIALKRKAIMPITTERSGLQLI